MLYDISPPIDGRLTVWPGDTPPSREVLLDMARGDTVTLSTLHATVHLGSHADAPSHYGRGTRTIDDAPLERYLGPCRVVGIGPARNGVLGLDSLDRVLIDSPRLLLRTGSYPDPSQFREDFAAIDPALIHLIADLGVTLIGIDTPSVDPAESKSLPAHRACLERDVCILEGLVLDGVPDGLYELIALPLKLVGFDASPVRAVLRTIA